MECSILELTLLLIPDLILVLLECHYIQRLKSQSGVVTKT